jgi:glycosyltransferase involved in cell wall biosynthesis
MKNLKACFFSREGQIHISKQQYSLQDIRILKDFGFNTKIVSKFFQIPWNCDLYFAWWASGSFLPLIVAKLCSKPIIVIAGGNEVIYHIDSLYGIKGGYTTANIFKKLATILTLRYATEVFVVSTHMLAHVKRISGRDAKVLYNTVDTEKYIPNKISRKFITSVINFDEISFKNKRGILLLNAFKEFNKINPNIDLQLIGKGSNYLFYLKRYTESLGIINNVKFICDIPNESMPTYLNSSLLYVQLSDTETFGMSLVEAMSLEIPVLCSEKGAFPEIAGDLAFFVNNNDVNSITTSLINILNLNKESHDNIGRALRKRVIDNFEYKTRKAFLFNYFNNLNL